MKKVLILLYCFSSTVFSFSQNNGIDEMLKKIENQKDQNQRLDIIIAFYSNTADYNPLLDFKNAQKLLFFAKNNKDEIAESLALTQIGYDYRQFGNLTKSLEFTLKALEIAEANGNKKTICYVKLCLALIYRDLENYPKALSLLQSSEKSATELESHVLLEFAFQNLSEVYLAENKIDSALINAQKDYELSIRHNFKDWIGYTFLNLGSIHGKLGNKKLATSYLDMAINQGISTKSARQLSQSYSAKSNYFKEIGQIDSSMTNAKKAVFAVRNTPFSNYAIKPAKMLLDIYRKQNVDSAFKYSEIYRNANDSLFSSKAIQQTEQMTFQNEFQQQQIEEERIQNIQYAFIALGIIILLTLFLLLSRTVIVNERLISFFAILGLLIIFEFINLLIHPFLEEVTHHSPILMLLALVALASILIPLHHKLEKWIKEKMTEKNKAIRLAAAKKTIEDLETKTTS